MTELSPTERAIRVIVAQHVAGKPPETAPQRAAAFKPRDVLADLGVTDGAFAAMTVNLERTFGFDLPDDLWEQAKTVADVVALVEHYATRELAA